MTTRRVVCETAQASAGAVMCAWALVGLRHYRPGAGPGWVDFVLRGGECLDVLVLLLLAGLALAVLGAGMFYREPW